MNVDERYQIWCDITITHDYYPPQKVPIELSPDRDTKVYLLRNKILFKKIEPNHWGLLKQMKENSEINPYGLSFHIKARNSDFHHVTLLPFDARNPALFQSFHIPDEKENKGQIRWHIPATEKYFEYICIPQYYTGDSVLRLRENKNLFEIEGPDKVHLPDAGEVFRFVSKKQIPLRQIYPYKVQLWEIRDSGERLISDRIPCPQPSSRSLFYPNDTITTYYYF